LPSAGGKKKKELKTNLQAEKRRECPTSSSKPRSGFSDSKKEPSFRLSSEGRKISFLSIEKKKMRKRRKPAKPKNQNGWKEKRDPHLAPLYPEEGGDHFNNVALQKSGEKKGKKGDD